MTVVYATSDGEINSENATYATAAEGPSAAVYGFTLTVGQTVPGNYFCYESFVQFDTSGIPDTDTVTAVSMGLDGAVNGSDTDFTVQARTFNWGAILAGGDWRAGSALGALTLLATFATSGYSTGYNVFTENGTNFQTAIDKAGITYLVLNSSRHEAATTPTGNEYVVFSDSSEAGTTVDPYVDVAHAGAATLLGRSYNINQAVNRASTF